jgi:hypothetical protein
MAQKALSLKIGHEDRLARDPRRLITEMIDYGALDNLEDSHDFAPSTPQIPDATCRCTAGDCCAAGFRSSR